MTKKEQQLNSLIDTFMYGQCCGKHYFGLNQYNKRWELLMPVIERIKEEWDAGDIDTQLLDENTTASSLKHIRIWADIEVVWEAAIDFIEWYNQYKNIPVYEPFQEN